ncbi:MAG: hypothetical protein WAU36_07675 [Cyclobacteriaceae bacterium]
MIKGYSLVFTCFILLIACQPETKAPSAYPNQVGDISFDSKVDDPNFKICNSDRVLQYYHFGKGLQYKGEKSKINELFKDGYKNTERQGETGFVTIRFIVNCEGKTGWYRIQAMDKAYKAREFNEKLVDELLELTKKLDGWVIGVDHQNRVDYYQYLTFKLTNGQLIEIMP